METTGKHIVVRWGDLAMMYLNVTGWSDETIADCIAEVFTPNIPADGTISVEDCDQCGREAAGMMALDHGHGA